MYITVNFWQIY